ncbi:hypothetical protein DFH06DRAFT_1341735 [Mycena polygramma]|nr:hypothetical protein DFH06DRAFT_1341735 [Mycena polygramma]
MRLAPSLSPSPPTPSTTILAIDISDSEFDDADHSLDDSFDDGATDILPDDSVSSNGTTTKQAKPPPRATPPSSCLSPRPLSCFPIGAAALPRAAAAAAAAAAPPAAPTIVLQSTGPWIAGALYSVVPAADLTAVPDDSEKWYAITKGEISSRSATLTRPWRCLLSTLRAAEDSFTSSNRIVAI